MKKYRITIVLLSLTVTLVFTYGYFGRKMAEAVSSAETGKVGQGFPQGTRLLFSSRRSGNQEAYVLDPATKKWGNMTNNSADDGYPKLSPDGLRFSFSSNREGFWTIYLIRPGDTRPVRLLKDRSESGYADWSPDSRQLVFAAAKTGSGKNDLYTSSVDGGTVRRLTNHPAEDVHPAWSPDGRKIAFASERDGNRRIYAMNIDGTGLICLTNDRWYSDYPAWSPDGSQIAFASDRDSRDSSRLELYVMNADGSNIRRITNNPADDRHPCWSPDGKSLAFASNRLGDRDIFTMKSDGSSTFLLFRSAGDDEHPQWIVRPADSDANLAQNTYPGLSAAEVNLRRQLFRQMIADGEIKYQECVEWGETDPVKLLETKKMDINGDGIPELVVSGTGCAFQGARMGTQWIYRRSGIAFERLATIGAANNIIPLNTSTNGYRDLKVAYPPGNTYPEFSEIFRFDGRRYLDPQEQQKAKNRLSNQTPRGQQPPIPYEDHGACPFECCTYRRWTVKTRTLVRQDRNASSPISFTLQRGERVTGMTGVVITTQPGLARALKPASIGRLQVRQGEIVYLLTYAGEGSYKVWYRGKVEEIAIEGDDVFTLIREPLSIWWVKVKNSKGQIGWTNQTSNFDEMDACG